MKPFAARLAGCLLALSLAWSSGLASAQQEDAGVADAIHATVQMQLQALATDDAETAFELVSSTSRLLLGSPANFLRIIRQHYPAVYRHRQAVFEAPEIHGEQALQVVSLTDGDNLVWIAVYVLQQEIDGSWKVDSCTLHETDSVVI